VSTTTHSRRRSAVALLAAITGIITTLIGVGASPAAAYCSGTGRPEPIYMSWGFESAQGGDASTTCNNDGVYHGWVADTATDGYCVEVQIRYNSVWHSHASSCSTSGTNYTYWNQPGSEAIRICKSGTSTCSGSYSLYGF
jgi:hypothetical protein